MSNNLADQILFSYGTLQKADVQQSTFGRRFDGSPDTLVGYRLVMVQIKDQDFVIASGAEYHHNLQYTGLDVDFIEGTALRVTKAELEQADAYEPDVYKRTRAALKSGAEAWIYLQESP